MSDSKPPSDSAMPAKPPASGDSKPPEEPAKKPLPEAKAPVPEKRGFISFVGRLRRSSRKTRASTIAAREAAAAAHKKEKEAERNRGKSGSPEDGKSSEGGISRATADEMVKPIRPEDLKDVVPGTAAASPAKPASGVGGEPGRLSIEKVERVGTRSQRTIPARSVVILDEKAEKRRRTIVTGFKITLAAVFFGVIGVLVFLSLRETRVKVAINTSPAFVVEPEALIVTDFQERIDLVKRDLQRREDPLRKALASIDQDLSAAKADYAGRAARRKLLVEAMDKDKSTIPTIIEGTRKSLDKLWREDADNLDAEYERKKDAFNKEIGGRAKQLNLKNYAPSEELDAPEIAVNAFRLALYSAPEGVQTGKEREWAENRLKGWRKYEDEWSDRQSKIKQEADALRQTVQPEVDEVKGRVNVKQEEIAAVDLEIEEFGKEVARHEEKMKDQREQLSSVGQPFLEDLIKAPNDYVIARWTVEKLGLLDIRNLDRDPRFPPGEYRLLIRAKKKGIDYWAEKNFLVTKYKTTKVIFTDEDFFTVKSLLESN